MQWLDFDPKFKVDYFYADGWMVKAEVTHGTELIESFYGNHPDWRVQDFMRGVEYATNLRLEIEEVHHGVDNEI